MEKIIMIDFWELAGRLLLKDKAERIQEIYTDLLPLGVGGTILDEFADSAGLPFPEQNFYDQLRDYLVNEDAAQPPLGKYAGLLFSPAVSMFALGEVGVMFFNGPNRAAFESLSDFTRAHAATNGRTDTSASPRFYIVLALLMVDSTTRDKNVAKGEFLGLMPTGAGEPEALTALANDAEFVKRANTLCFENDWENGSSNPLRYQKYGKAGDLPFRHFRFRANLQP